MTIFPNNRRAVFAFVHDTAMAALSLVVSLYLRIGCEIVGYKPRLTALLHRLLYRDRGERVPVDRALPRHLALCLAARSVQHRPRGEPDGSRLSAGNVCADPARGAAALDPADRLVRADRAVGRAAPRLSAVQGSRPRPRSRTRQAPERAGAADQRQGRGRYLHPRDDRATRARSIGWSGSLPTPPHGSAARSAGFRFWARSIRSKR